jgi:hypothetical protein
MKKSDVFNSRWDFDVMVFSNNEDYECYIEAVNLLLEEGKKHRCTFESDPSVIQKGVHSFDKDQDEFLFYGKKSNEYFIVVDNTQWPEILSDDSLIDPAYAAVGGSNDPFDVFLDVDIKTTYNATGYHVFWTNVFTIIISILGTIFLIVLAFYFRLNWVYQECEITKKKGDRL